MAYAALDPMAPLGATTQHNADIYAQFLQNYSREGTEHAAHHYYTAIQNAVLAPRPQRRPFAPRLTCLIGPCSATDWLPLWLDYHGAIFGHGALGVMVLPQAHLPDHLKSLCHEHDVALYETDGSTGTVTSQAFFEQAHGDIVLCSGPETLIGAITDDAISLSPIHIKFGVASLWRAPQRVAGQFLLDAVDLSVTRFHVREEAAITVVALQPALPTENIADIVPPQIFAIKLPVIYAPQTIPDGPGTPTLVSQSLRAQMQRLLPQKLAAYGLVSARPSDENITQKTYDLCDIDLFSAGDYMTSNPDVAKTLAAAFVHYCQVGYRGGQPYKKETDLLEEPKALPEQLYTDAPDRLDGVTPLNQRLDNSDLPPHILTLFEEYLDLFPNNTDLLMVAKQNYLIDRDFTLIDDLLYFSRAMSGWSDGHRGDDGAE